MMKLSIFFSYVSIPLAVLSAVFWFIAAQDSKASDALLQMSSNNNLIIRPDLFQTIAKSFIDQSVLNKRAAYCAAAAAFSQGLSFFFEKILSKI